MRTPVAARTPLTRSRASFAAALAAYLETLRAHHYSPSLLSRASHVLPRLFAHLRRQGVGDLRQVSETHLLSFARALGQTTTGGPAAFSTQGAYATLLRRFFAFLEKSGVILRNPATALPAYKVVTLPRSVLSETQAGKLMSAPNASTAAGRRDVAILEVLYGTAIRLSECVRLDVGDLDLAAGVLLVRNGKGKKDRFVPIPARALAALDRYLIDVRPHFVRDPQQVALFLGFYGRRLAPVSLGALVRAHGQAIGARVSPHSLRHACATHLLRHGADVRHVQQLLGHRDIQTTARYTAVALRDLRQVLARAHPRERQRKRRR